MTPYQALLAAREEIFTAYVRGTPEDTLDALTWASRELAPLVAEGEICAHDVWDDLQNVAEITRLVAIFGQDCVQVALAHGPRIYESAKQHAAAAGMAA